MYLTMFRATKISTTIDNDAESRHSIPSLRIRLEDDDAQKLELRVYLAEGMQFCPHKVGDLIVQEPDLEPEE